MAAASRGKPSIGKNEAVAGALVRMLMPWDVKVIAELDEYFRRLLVPQGVDLQVNGRRIEPRAVAHRIEAKLPTELFEAGRWIRPGARHGHRAGENHRWRRADRVRNGHPDLPRGVGRAVSRQRAATRAHESLPRRRRQRLPGQTAPGLPAAAAGRDEQRAGAGGLGGQCRAAVRRQTFRKR